MRSSGQQAMEELRWPHWVGLAAAGIVSFLAAAYWAQTEGLNVVEPRDEQQIPVKGGVPIEAENSVLHEEGGVSPGVVFGDERSSRRALALSVPQSQNAKQRWNPFGKLQARDEPTSATPVQRGTTLTDTLRTQTTASATSKAIPPQIAVAPPQTGGLQYEAIGSISGDMIADGKPVAFLRLGPDVLVVREGEILEGYRVTHVSRDQVVLTSVSGESRRTLTLRP